MSRDLYDQIATLKAEKDALQRVVGKLTSVTEILQQALIEHSKYSQGLAERTLTKVREIRSA